MKQQFKKFASFLFEKLQKLGIDVLPQHFYSEIPNIGQLKKDGFWKRSRTMFGIRGIELSEQIKFLSHCCSPHLIDVQKEKHIHEDARKMNGEGGFGLIEADFLFCFINTIRPKKVIQIGAGLSTAVILSAAKESNYSPIITAIDPYPNNFLKTAAQENIIKLIKEEAQKLPLETFLNLDEGDLLFIDSTHTVKPGSEVNFLILEVLPRLKKGVYVHFHDVYFPYDYSRDLLSGALFFPNESALLQAFLTQNPQYQIMLSLSMLHYGATDEMKKYLPRYTPQENDFGLRTEKDGGSFPSSIYLQKIHNE